MTNVFTALFVLLGLALLLLGIVETVSATTLPNIVANLNALVAGIGFLLLAAICVLLDIKKRLGIRIDPSIDVGDDGRHSIEDTEQEAKSERSLFLLIAAAILGIVILAYVLST